MGEETRTVRERVRERVDRFSVAVRHACARSITAARNKLAHVGGILAATLLFLSGWLYFGVAQPPVFFPLETIITIPQGSTVREAGDILRQEQVVRSSFAFRVLMRLRGPEAHVLAGDYYFTERLTLSRVIDRVSRGEFGLTPIRVTLPEGATTYQMREVLEKKLPRFDPVAFDLLVKDKEGYLYPDTYFFLPNVTASDVVTELERTFYEKVGPLEEAIASFGKPLHETIIMASLLEKEARTTEDRRAIAGVLWHRLSIDMPLQVDAVFGFIERTDTFSPNFSHLETESEYNTYKYQGLPPGPIGNPSVGSIEAAVTPDETEALFYLHGRDGVLRLADTYEEHLVNRRKYLD